MKPKYHNRGQQKNCTFACMQRIRFKHTVNTHSNCRVYKWIDLMCNKDAKLIRTKKAVAYTMWKRNL